MKYIKRQIEARVLELSKSWPVILLTGPSQAGKTTMLRVLAERESAGRQYVSLDDLHARKMAKTDPKKFLQLYKPPVVIDEIQYAPELFAYIKIQIDKKPNPGDFWLIGSQIFCLMRSVQESLAGCVALLHMLPLSQHEIISEECASNFKTVNKLQSMTTAELFQRIWNGCMPSSGQVGDRNIYYSSYLSNYVERDIRVTSGTVWVLKFVRFITAAAVRVSQHIDYESIAVYADIDQSTCKSWINILEKLGIVFLIYPHSDGESPIKTPELYFYDTGFVCYLTRWSSPEVAARGAMSDALVQNFYLSEVMKYYINEGKEPYLPHYRDCNAGEGDVLFKGDGKIFSLKNKETAAQNNNIQNIGAIDNLQTTIIPTEKVNSPPSIPLLDQKKNTCKNLRFRTLGRIVEILVVVAAVTVLLVTSFLPVLQVSGNSMRPTLRDGNILVLLRTGGGYKSGDICGLYWENKLLLKRVIALPGSYVDIDEDGNVSVDGVPLDEPYLTQKSIGECDIEFPYQVPNGKLFVMGDNRVDSIDSRSSSVGCIDEDKVLGIALLRVWPLSELRWMR
jgi:signal peptidase I